MAKVAKAGPGQRQEPGASSRFLTWYKSQGTEQSPASLTGALAESDIRKSAGKHVCIHIACQQIGGTLTCYTKAPKK